MVVVFLSLMVVEWWLNGGCILSLIVVVALMRHRGEGATKPGGFCQLISFATPTNIQQPLNHCSTTVKPLLNHCFYTAKVRKTFQSRYALSIKRMNKTPKHSTLNTKL